MTDAGYWINIDQGVDQAVSKEIVDLLDVLEAASVIVNSNNTVVRASQSAISLGLVQTHFLAHKQTNELIEEARKSQAPIEREFELVTGLRGERSFVRARAAKLKDGYMLLLVEDRTEAHRVDETRRDFIANISHELKTPIGAIQLLSEALQDGAADPELVRRFAGNLRREAERLGNLVQEVITLTRLQAAESNSDFAQVDLAGVIHDAVERNALLAEQRDVKVKVHAPQGHVVLGDAESLAMAVRNLIENAIVYSDEGSQVGVGLRAVKGIAEVSVTDNGVGIPVEEQERIFERFYRVDASRSRQTGGTGLGLSIVKHVALNHRGEVALFSQVGTGSTFTLRIPEIVPDVSRQAKKVS